jgi:hypothetical protein
MQSPTDPRFNGHRQLTPDDVAKVLGQDPQPPMRQPDPPAIAPTAKSLAVVTAEAFERALAAADRWPPYNSAHEALGVALEEFEELKAEILKQQNARSVSAMRSEALQLAAVMLRIVAQIDSDSRWVLR